MSITERRNQDDHRYRICKFSSLRKILKGYCRFKLANFFFSYPKIGAVRGCLWSASPCTTDNGIIVAHKAEVEGKSLPGNV